MPKKKPYVVEKITGWNFKKDITHPTFYDTEYVVKWKNYKETTTEPLVNLILDNGYLNDDLKTFILNNKELLKYYKDRWNLQETYRPNKSLSDVDQALLKKFNKTWEIEKIVDSRPTKQNPTKITDYIFKYIYWGYGDRKYEAPFSKFLDEENGDIDTIMETYLDLEKNETLKTYYENWKKEKEEKEKSLQDKLKEYIQNFKKVNPKIHIDGVFQIDYIPEALYYYKKDDFIALKYGELLVLQEILKVFKDIRNELEDKNMLDINNDLIKKFIIISKIKYIENQVILKNPSIEDCKNICYNLIGNFMNYKSIDNKKYICNILVLRSLYFILFKEQPIFRNFILVIDNLFNYLISNNILERNTVKTTSIVNYTIIINNSKDGTFPYDNELDYQKISGVNYSLFFENPIEDDDDVNKYNVNVEIEPISGFKVPSITDEVKNEIIKNIEKLSSHFKCSTISELFDNTEKGLAIGIINSGRINYSDNKAYTLFASCNTDSIAGTNINSIIIKNPNKLRLSCETSRFIYYYLLIQCFDHIHDLKRYIGDDKNHFLLTHHKETIKNLIIKILNTNPKADSFLNELIYQLYEVDIPIDNPKWSEIVKGSIKDKPIKIGFISNIENTILQLVFNYFNNEEVNKNKNIIIPTEEGLHNVIKNIFIDNASKENFRNVSTLMMLLDGGAWKRSSYFVGNNIEYVFNSGFVEYYVNLKTEIKEDNPWCCITYIFKENNKYNFTRHYCCLSDPIHNRQVWDGLVSFNKNNNKQYKELLENPCFYIINTGLKELTDNLQFPCVSASTTQQLYAFSNPNMLVDMTEQEKSSYNPAFPFPTESNPSFQFLRDKRKEGTNIIFTTPDKMNGANILFLIKNFSKIALENIHVNIQINVDVIKSNTTIFNNKIKHWKIIKLEKRIRYIANSILFNTILDFFGVEVNEEIKKQFMPDPNIDIEKDEEMLDKEDEFNIKINEEELIDNLSTIFPTNEKIREVVDNLYSITNKKYNNNEIKEESQYVEEGTKEKPIIIDDDDESSKKIDESSEKINRKRQRQRDDELDDELEKLEKIPKKINPIPTEVFDTSKLPESIIKKHLELYETYEYLMKLTVALMVGMNNPDKIVLRGGKVLFQTPFKTKISSMLKEAPGAPKGKRILHEMKKEDLMSLQEKLIIKEAPKINNRTYIALNRINKSGYQLTEGIMALEEIVRAIHNGILKKRTFKFLYYLYNTVSSNNLQNRLAVQNETEFKNRLINMINIIRNRLEIVNDNEIVTIDGIDIKDKDVLEIINDEELEDKGMEVDKEMTPEKFEEMNIDEPKPESEPEPETEPKKVVEAMSKVEAMSEGGKRRKRNNTIKKSKILNIKITRKAKLK